MRNAVLFAVLVLFGTACRQLNNIDEWEVSNFQPEVAFPLVNSNTTLQEILESADDLSGIVVDPDGRIRFRYIGDIITRTSDDIFGTLTSALPSLIPVASKKMPLPFNLPNGVKIDQVVLKKGDFVYYIENPNKEPIKVDVSFPQILKDGKPYSFSVDIAAFSGSGARPSATNQIAPASLAGYTLVPKNDTVYVEYEATTPGGSKVNAGLFLVRITNLQFSYAEGFFGSLLYKGGRDTVKIDFFKNYVKGNIYFADPRVSFFLENSFGIPSRSIVRDFKVFTVDNRALGVESVFLRNGFDFPYPGINEVGQVKRSTFTFDKTNSNLDVLFGAGPTAVAYDVDAFTNPDGNIGQKGFITDKSFYRVQVEVELPLYGSVSNFLAQDVFDVDLSKYNNVKQLEFKVVADNEMPLDIAIQGYFLSSTGQVLDSLMRASPQIIPGAQTDVQGVANKPSSKTTLIGFDEIRFARIRTAKKLRLQASIATGISNPGKSVRVLASQKVNIKIGAKATLQ
jgi:hypothetical protein